MTAAISAARGWLDHRWTTRVLLALLICAFLVSVAWRFNSGPAQARRGYVMPQSAQLEASLGIRISQAAVVADGGIVELRYTVLDPQKATTFQSNVAHPPVLRSEQNRGTAVYRTALMKQGHTLRPGQSYFILYLNNHGVIHSGGTLEIDAGGGRLVHVPVR